MSKTKTQSIIIPVEYGLVQQSAEMLRSSLVQMAQSQTGGYSSNIKSQFQSVYQTIEQANQKMTGINLKNVVDPKELADMDMLYESISRQISSVAKSISSIPKTAWFGTPQQIADLDKANIELDVLESNLKDVGNQMKHLKSPDVRITDLIPDSQKDKVEELLRMMKLGNVSKVSSFKKGATKVDINEITRDIDSRVDQTLDKRTGEYKRQVKEANEYKAALANLMNLENLRGQKLSDLSTKETQIKSQLISKQNQILQLEQAIAASDPYLAESEEQKKHLQLLKDEQVQLEANLQLAKNDVVLKKEQEKSANVFNKAVGSLGEGLKQQLAMIFSFNFAYQQTRRIIRDAIKVISELDKSFNEIAMVTTYTTAQAWNMKNAFEDIAKTTGFTTVEIAKLSVEFFRQGRALSEVISLTTAAASAARVAGISVEDSVKYLTSAVNGYQMSANQAMMVSDKFAALAAASATDYEELAIALSKVAAQAYSAGVNMDNLMGFIAKAIETTREAPENIGTAFKTIFARMSELKDYGKTLEDGMDVNRVDKALAAIGVTLTDQNNELRNLDEVLIDVGKKWSTLNKNQKAYVATALAGTRQQTRLLSVMEDFDRTMELVDISAQSLGATYAQQSKYMNSIAFAMNGLTVSWQKLISELSNSQAIIGVVNIVTTLIEVMGAIASIPLGAVFLAALVPATLLLAAAVKMKYLATEQLILSGALKTDLAGQTILKQVQLIFESLITKQKELQLKYTSATIIATTAYVAVILAVIGGVVLIVKLLLDWVNRHKILNEQMKKTQAAMYNFRKKSTDMQVLLDKYDELNNKVVKTNEDLEKMSELLQQIKDLGGDEIEIDVENLNRDIIAAWQAEQITKANEEFEKGKQDLIKIHETFADAYQEGGAATKQMALYAEAMRLSGSSTYDEFLKLDKEIQKKWNTLARMNLIIPVTYAERGVGAAMSGSRRTAEDTSLHQEVQKFASQLLDSNFDSESMVNQEAILKSLGYYNLSQAAKDEVDKTLVNVLNFRKTVEMLGSLPLDSVMFPVDELVKWNSLFSQTMNEETIRPVMQTLATRGPAEAFKTFTLSLEGSGKSLLELLDLAQQFNNQIKSASFEQLTDMGTSLNGIYNTLGEVNEMLAGETEFNLTRLTEIISMYPEISKHIIDGGEISQETMEKVANQEYENLKTSLQNKQLELENDLAINNARLELIQEMYEAEKISGALKAKYLVGVTEQQLKDEIIAYAKAAETKSQIDGTFIKYNVAELVKGFGGIDTSVDAMMTAQIDNLKKQSQVIVGQINAVKTSLSVLERRKNLKALDGKDNAKAAKEYEAKLNQIYVIQQGINYLNEKLSQLQSERELLEGDAYVQSLLDENNILVELNKQYALLGKVQKEQQEILLSGLTPALRGVVEIIDGKMIPNMSKYNKLTSKQKEALDEAVLEFNTLSTSINENTNTLNENTKAIEDNLQALEDTLIEGYEKVIEALKNSEKKRLDILLKSIEEEKKLLDKRKALYEEAFSEEDYQNSLKDTDTQRSDIITELAQLEGATDLASVRRREELLKQKADLDKNYNKQVLDYNRTSLLESIDEEKEALETRATNAQEAYEEYVNNIMLLEQQALDLMMNGAEEVIAFLKEHSPEYEKQISLVKDNMVDEWKDMYTQVDTIFKNLEGSLPSFSEFFTEIQRAMEAMAELNRQNASTGTTPTNLNPGDTGGTGFSGIKYTPWVLDYGGYDPVRKQGYRYEKRDKETWKNGVVVDRKKETRGPIWVTVTSNTSPTASGSAYSPTMTAYASGGEADYTGAAWLDGTKKRPERVLSAVQTDLFNRMVQQLEANPSSVNNDGSIHIENITITTPSLNSAQDFDVAGKILAKSINRAATTRGININKRK